MHTIHKHLNDETLIFPIHEHLQLHASQYKQKTQHPSHNLHKHTTYFNTQRLKNTIFNNGRYTTNIPTDPHTDTTTDMKTNMRHMHTSIVSRHLATRGINKIPHTPPPHISSSEDILPCLTRRTLAQLRRNKSYLHKVDAPNHIHPPLCPLCNTHTSSLQLHPHIHHIVNPGFVETPLVWTELLARWTGKAGCVDHKQEHRTPPPPPLARIMGVGRQQQLLFVR